MPKKRTDLTFDPTPEQPLGMPVPINSAVEALALVIVWSRTEKRRVGECVPVPPKDALIGRGGVRPDDPADRLGFAATRPGCVIDGGPLAAPTLSRVHVRIAATADGVMFERTGKGPVELDGHRVEHGHAPVSYTHLTLPTNREV